MRAPHERTIKSPGVLLMRRYCSALVPALLLAFTFIFALPSVRAQASANGIVYIANSYSPEAQAAKPYGIYVFDAATGQDQRVLDPHKLIGANAIVREASWSADGKQILFVSDKLTGQGEFLATVDADGSNYQQVTSPTRSIQINAPAWSPDGSKIAFGQFDLGDGGSVTTSEIVIINSDGSSPTPLSFEGLGTDISHMISAVAWSPDSRQIAFNSSQGVFVANVDGSGLTNIFTDSYAGTPAWSPDGKQIAFTGFGEIIAVDPTGANRQTLYSFDYGNVSDLAWSPDGKQLLVSLSGSSGDGLAVADLASQKLGVLVAGSVGFLPAAWQPGGASVEISPSQEAAAAALNAPPPTATPSPTPEGEAGKQIRQMSAGDVVLGVAFSPDGKTLVSAGADGSVTLWDVATGDQIKQFDGHEDYVYSVAFSPDGATIVSGGGGQNGDNSIRLWDVASGQQTLKIDAPDIVYAVAFAPDGKSVLSGGSDQSARLWDVTTGKQLRRFAGHYGAVNSVGFSADGTKIVTSSDDGDVRVWNAENGGSLATLSHGGAALSAAFSPDASTVIAGAQYGEITLWDVKTRQSIQSFEGQEQNIQSVAFSPDGRFVLSGGDDLTVRLWDVQTGKAVAVYSGSRGSVRGVAFSPDGTMIASGSIDQSVRLWSVPASAIPVATPVPTATAVGEVAPTPAADTSATCTVTAGQTVKRRGGPGTTFAQTGSLTTGQTAEANGQTFGADNKLWYRLDDESWVRSDLVALDPACAGLPDVSG